MLTSILDAQGNKIFYHPSMAVAPREKISLKVFEFFSSFDDQEDFLNGLYAHVLNSETSSQPDKLEISLQNSDFQDYCLGYGSQKIINSALDEDLVSAYHMLLSFSDHPKLQNLSLENMEITEEDVATLATSLEKVPELHIALSVCNIQSEISKFFDTANGKQITSYQAYRLEEKFDDIADFLNDEQKAAGYYNLSIVYRSLRSEYENAYYAYRPIANVEDSNAEKNCLKKVLDYSCDYKRINYCINRMGTTRKIAGKIIDAYKRALSTTNVPSDLRKINRAIAETYLNDYQPTCGFKPDEKEEQKLQYAEQYFLKATKFADKAEKLEILKTVAKLQLQQKKHQQWCATMTTLAFKYLKGKERCQTLIDISSKSEKFQTAYLERALYEADKSRQMNKQEKEQLVCNITHILRPIYEKGRKTDLLQQLDKILSKYNSNQKIKNPLLKFKVSALEKS